MLTLRTRLHYQMCSPILNYCNIILGCGVIWHRCLYENTTCKQVAIMRLVQSTGGF